MFHCVGSFSSQQQNGNSIHGVQWHFAGHRKFWFVDGKKKTRRKAMKRRNRSGGLRRECNGQFMVQFNKGVLIS